MIGEFPTFSQGIPHSIFRRRLCSILASCAQVVKPGLATVELLPIEDLGDYDHQRNIIIVVKKVSATL